MTMLAMNTTDLWKLRRSLKKNYHIITKFADTLARDMIIRATELEEHKDNHEIEDGIVAVANAEQSSNVGTVSATLCSTVPSLTSLKGYKSARAHTQEYLMGGKQVK